MKEARQSDCKKRVITILLFAHEIKIRHEFCNIYYSLLPPKATLLNLL